MGYFFIFLMLLSILFIGSLIWILFPYEELKKMGVKKG